LFFGSSEIFAEPRQGRERAQVASSDITRARRKRISAKPNLFRGTYVGLEPLSDMLKREAVLSFGLGSDAIRGNRYFEIPHIRIICRIEHADVGGESGENQTLDLESLQEHFKRSGEETRVHRLENKVIILG